jgi:hypothetical protein
MDATVMHLPMMIGAERHYVRGRKRADFLFADWRDMMRFNVRLPVFFHKAYRIPSERFA